MEENKINQIKQKLKEHRDNYELGIMMTMKESIEATRYCNLFLKKIEELEKLNISEEEKISMLIDYAINVYISGFSSGDICYKYNIEDMLETIESILAKKK